MSENTAQKAIELSSGTAEAHGVYVVDVTYGKTENGNTLCFYIDKEGGVGIDDCEAFSRDVEKVLDESGIMNGAYSLDVSSPGAERKLTKEREFLYYIGRTVDVKLYGAIEGMKEFTGTLAGFSDDIAGIDCEGKNLRIPRKEAVYIKLHFAPFGEQDKKNKIRRNTEK